MKNPIIEIPPSPFKHGGQEHHAGIKHDGETLPKSTVEGTLRACSIILQATDPKFLFEDGQQQPDLPCKNKQLDLL